MQKTTLTVLLAISLFILCLTGCSDLTATPPATFTPSNEVTEQTTPTKSKQEAPVEPKQEAPAEPKQEAPAEPKQEAPAEPKQEAPAEPKQEAPAEPKQEAPVEPKQEAPVEPKQETPVASMVWLPKSGKKYHSNAACSNMSNPTQATKAVAEQRGYTPCKKCW